MNRLRRIGVVTDRSQLLRRFTTLYDARKPLPRELHMTFVLLRVPKHPHDHLILPSQLRPPPARSSRRTSKSLQNKVCSPATMRSCTASCFACKRTDGMMKVLYSGSSASSETWESKLRWTKRVKESRSLQIWIRRVMHRVVVRSRHWEDTQEGAVLTASSMGPRTRSQAQTMASCLCALEVARTGTAAA